jgi:ring-1,2-phenylacetyl-CoA epoxidase subunit PaaC
MDAQTKSALFEFLLRLGDDRLILGHRLSEWCGHGPILEEDIALGNVALDCLGQATNFLRLAGQVEEKGRDEDALAYFRSDRDYRNSLLVELPRGDFGFTVLRQFFFSAYSHFLFEELKKSSHADFAGICEKAQKEARYHVRHSSEWVIRLGDGTDESHGRMQKSLDEMWRFVGDIFYTDAVEETLTSKGLIPSLKNLRSQWEPLVNEVLASAKLQVPANTAPNLLRGRLGNHTEHLGRLLAEMQIVARSHPGARW